MRLLKVVCPAVLCVFCVLLLATTGKAQKVSFPGTAVGTKSPDGRYVIQNDDLNGQEPPHTLTLIEKPVGKTSKIHSYDRHVEILWSPNSDGFVVNDYEASDSTRPLLFALPWKGEKTDLLGELERLLRKRKEGDLITGNHHVYLTVRRWLSKEELLCKLWEYGEVSRNGFTKYYVYTIGRGFRDYR